MGGVIMNKIAVIEAVASKTGLSKKEAGMAVEAVLDVISESLVKGETVTFTGFGNFMVSKRAARDGINPATKAKIKIPAVIVPKFKAGKALKEAVKK